MSRTQWWSLTALLAVAIGLLCGPAAFGGSGAAGVRAASAVRALSQGAASATDASAPAPATGAVHGSAPDPATGAADASAPGSASGAVSVSRPAAVEAADTDADAGGPVPGCGKLRDHDGEPAVPSRVRAGHDQAPGLAPWGMPAATGASPAEPPPGMRARAPAPYTPTPVELSVLRV
ncbi:hypothetical protein [Streptomyces sp. V2I9]|uniref:hypothetical protein n=1 Tax=Streptomyces sp. V2I9 TaxID=3042304 RepID=UPI002789AC43|nr:hypothetical protein [Streptomyces sp. V2I9]MDQ0985439.1 type IV secretory pathway TrbL component [Streptomyces sp. V2I9]